MNIEATYAAITGEYKEFANLCFVDTLDNVVNQNIAGGLSTSYSLFAGASEENVERIKRQNDRKISVVIGNPPYNANQANENDNNKNRGYPGIDSRIKQTYIEESTAQKTKLYDMYARFFRWASDRLAADGVLAFVTNRSFIDSRTFDGFRKTVGNEFAEAYVVDLGGDVRANPKLSGTKHNVFGIQTGVAISFFVKRQGVSGKKGCRVFYARRPEMETAEEKLAWLAASRASQLDLEEVRPDAQFNWVGNDQSDFSDLLPLVSRATKAATSTSAQRAIGRLYSLGVSTNRDEWVVAESPSAVRERAAFLLRHYESRLGTDDVDKVIKWSETLLRRCKARQVEAFEPSRVVPTLYRPFVRFDYYHSRLLIDRPGQADQLFPAGAVNQAICFMCGDRQPFSAIAAGALPNLNMFSADAVQYLSLYEYGPDGTRHDNITDWALKQFQQHYHPGPGRKPAAITKEAIFHYVYAVLHDPLYREKYAQNLKREFPRVPLYGTAPAHFEQWAAWGAELMQLHIGYDTVDAWEIKRTDTPDTKAHAAGQAPKSILKSLPDEGCIVIDTETTLSGIPQQAWSYKLGNRSALDWVLDQHKERKPKDPTIREKFDTYRFADHKERVITLLARVTRVSVETVRLVEALKAGPR